MVHTKRNDKAILMRKFLLLVATFVAGISIQLFANNKGSWLVEYGKNREFIENKGQFNIRHHSLNKRAISYAVQESGKMLYFTPNGLIHHFYTATKNKNRKKGDGKPKAVSTHELIDVEWVGANSDVKIIASGKSDAYHAYTELAETLKGDDIKCYGYKKLLYKNLYNNIDVEYTIHPESGIKYSLILHPGANLSDVKLRYVAENKIVKAENGNLIFATSFGDIIEHAPLTFYQKNSKAVIASAYEVSNNIITFKLDAYDKNQTVVIDPWVQSPNFNTQWKCVWECDKDAAGNVYLIGGVMPMQLQKYSNAGTLLWTHNTPYDTANFWLGTFAVDNAGNSYVTAGSVARIQKVNTAGTVVWNNTTAPGGILTMAEYWNITFNCDETRLIVGGTATGGVLPTIYQIDMNSGNVSGSLQATSGSGTEVRTIAPAGNGKYYFLSHDSIGYINQNFSACGNPTNAKYTVSNTYNLGYKCENFRVNNSGIHALRTFNGFAYVNRGNRLDKRDLATLAIVASAPIPGGNFATVFLGGSQVQNSGIDIDDCGNIFVGSKNQVVKFDQNLNQLATYPTSYNVYDVNVKTSGEIVAAGSTGDASSGARTGYIEVINGAACGIIPIICCDATICQVPPMCPTAPPVTLVTSTPGGTWSGPGVNSSGVFNPATAGAGTHTIVYTLPCGADSIKIVVNNCPPISVCKENNGNLTASAGNPAYTWAYRRPAGTYPVTNQAECTACGYTWNALFNSCLNGFSTVTSCNAPAQWVNFGTGTTVTPPSGSDSIRVTDNTGTVAVVRVSTVQMCNACPTITVSVQSKQDATCASATSGSATFAATGGTGAYTYTWSPATGSTTATASNLAAGTYNVTVRDANNCTGTGTVTINPSNSPTINPPVVVAETCSGQNNGSLTSASATGGTGTLQWNYAPASNPSNTTNISAFPVNNLAAGNYILNVRDANNCTATTNFTIAAGANCCNISLAVATVEPSCGQSNGQITVTPSPSGSYSYAWNNSLPNQAAHNNLAAGQYRVTVSETGNPSCNKDTAINLSNSNAPTVSFSNQTEPSCGQSNGSVSVTLAGGTAPYTVNLNGQTQVVPIAGTVPVNGIAAGVYNVSVTDALGCSAVNSVTFTEPNPPVITSINATAESCLGNNNGTANVVAIGGTGTLTYSWSNSETVSSISNLSPNTYSVTITDAAGCSATGNVAVSAGPACCTWNISAALAQPSCGANDGSINLTVLPAANYTYVWSNSAATANNSSIGAGTYSVTITNTDNNCVKDTSFSLSNPNAPTVSNIVASPETCAGNDGAVSITASGGTGTLNIVWSNSGTGGALANLAAGTYHYTVTDANNCQATGSVTVAPATGCCHLQASATATDASCAGNDGTISANVSTAGTPPYQYSIDGINYQQSATFPNVSAGNYVVYVTDAGSCLDTVHVSVSATNNTLNLTLSTVQPGCGSPTGSIATNVSGANGNTTYSWSNSETTSNIDGLQSGNYSVTVTDAAGCSQTASATITAVQSITVSIGDDVSFCQGESATLTAPSGFAAYLWSDGSTANTTTATASGVYSVTVTDANGCTASDALVATVFATPVIDLPTDTTIYENNAVLLNPVISGGSANATYLWQPDVNLSCNDCANPVANPDDTITYTLAYTSANNCTSNATITINVLKGALIYMPNVFSPNNDGSNDILFPLGVGIKSIKWKVFNRWGELVFATEDFNIGWDGTFKGVAQSPGVYVYTMQVTFLNKTARNYKGSVTLIR